MVMTASRIAPGERARGLNVAHAPLRSLQIGRGVAALLVVLFHLNNSIWGIAKYFPDPFSPLLSFGNAGVQFFFVLSGFIIYLVHSDDIDKPSRLNRFAYRRFVRIYPIYWIVLLAFIATLYFETFLGTADQRRIGAFITSVVLAPVDIEPILSVAWTLQHEVLFYVVFGVAIFNARAGLWLFAIWQSACLGNIVFEVSDHTSGVWLSANNLLFSIGLLAAYLFKTKRCPMPGRLAIGGAVAFISTGLHQVYIAGTAMPTTMHIIAYGVASGVAILGACDYERRHGLRAPHWLDALGDASYSIYLLHLPLLSVLGKLLFASGLAALLPQTLSLLVMLIGVAVIGMAFSKWVEMPLIAALSRKQDKRRATSQAQAAE